MKIEVRRCGRASAGRRDRPNARRRKAVVELPPCWVKLRKLKAVDLYRKSLRVGLTSLRRAPATLSWLQAAQAGADRNNSCQRCDFVAETATGLQRHNGLHNPDRREVCPACGLRFETRGHLRVHFRLHSGKKLFL